ncbi:MAG: hypothetical protein BGP09_04295 [Rhizobium sp. 60-20]|nr:MAG: hypothetical protein BGP09_04295 [Rhizobium sp. 60-20]
MATRLRFVAIATLAKAAMPIVRKWIRYSLFLGIGSGSAYQNTKGQERELTSSNCCFRLDLLLWNLGMDDVL